MKTNTFIIIVAIYSLVLALTAIFLPDLALEYFGGVPGNVNEQSSMNFIGCYQLAMSFLGYVAYRSTDKATKRGWLLATAGLTIFAIIIYFYNINMRQMPAPKTILIDCSIWAIMALGSLYFWNKEK